MKSKEKGTNFPGQIHPESRKATIIQQNMPPTYLCPITVVVMARCMVKIDGVMVMEAFETTLSLEDSNMLAPPFQNIPAEWMVNLVALTLINCPLPNLISQEHASCSLADNIALKYPEPSLLLSNLVHILEIYCHDEC